MISLKYRIENIEPVRIGDNATSQMGQTSALRYITGTAIRGYVISALYKELGEEAFENVKAKLLSSSVRFTNAYPCLRVKEDDRDEEYVDLIPVPAGFYEDKSEKHFANVLETGDIPGNMKRAGIGQFCRIKDGTIYGYNVTSGSDMKNNLNTGEQDDQKIFRSEYIERGHTFAGYIFVEDQELVSLIKGVFTDEIRIGSGRNQASGRCRVVDPIHAADNDFPGAAWACKGDLKSPVYMELLSDTVMRNKDGEYCGLDLEALEGILDVENLEIERCATSVRDVQGYNQVWRVRTPSAVMYQKGSTFRLTFEGIISRKKIRKVTEKGIGVRRNEGFGQVLFLGAYESIKEKKVDKTPLHHMISEVKEEKVKKLSIEEMVKALSDTERACLRIISTAAYQQRLRNAIPAYVVKHETDLRKGDVSDSVLGNLEAYATSYRYEFDTAKKKIDDYLDHAIGKQDKKRVQKESGNFRGVRPVVDGILTPDAAGLEMLLLKEDDAFKYNSEFMGLSKEELIGDQLGEIKLDLLTELIRYHNKKKDKKEKKEGEA